MKVQSLSNVKSPCWGVPLLLPDHLQLPNRVIPCKSLPQTILSSDVGADVEGDDVEGVDWYEPELNNTNAKETIIPIITIIPAYAAIVVTVNLESPSHPPLPFLGSLSSKGLPAGVYTI